MIEVRANTRSVEIILSSLSAGLSDVMAERVLAAAQHAVGEIRKEVYNTFDVKTGALARSYHEVFLGRDGETVSAAAQSDLIYARILDEGGTIVPKSVRMLAIPLPGVSVPVGQWPRHFGKGELTLIKRKGKHAVLAKVSKKGNIKPIFVLVPMVVIQPKNYLARAAENAQPGIEEILAGGIAEAVDEAKGGK